MDVLNLLHSLGAPHQIVLSKIDKILFPSRPAKLGDSPDTRHVEELEKICQGIREKAIGNRKGTTVMPDILCTSAMVPGLNGEVRLGINGLRWEICRAAGLDGSAVSKKEIKEWREQLTITTGVSGSDALDAAMVGR
jgi:GTP-binding protein